MLFSALDPPHISRVTLVAGEDLLVLTVLASKHGVFLCCRRVMPAVAHIGGVHCANVPILDVMTLDGQ